MAENDAHYNGTTDNGEGTLPQMNGSAPQADGSLPQTEATLPQTDGSLPQMDGSLPQTDGSLPQMDGSLPQTGETMQGTTPTFSEQAETPMTNSANTASPSNSGRSITGPMVSGPVVSGPVVSLPFPGSSSSNPAQSFPWVPTFPGCPSCGAVSPQNYGQVRFLNASTNSMTVNISIDGTVYASNSRFATLSNYDWISDGFHTVTVRRANGLRSTLLQQTFPFTSGQKITMVLTDSPEGGLELIRVIDNGCNNLPSNSGCFRFANMTYSGSNLDLLLSGQTIFRNIRYQSVSPYKQAVAGNYQFTVVTASSYSFIRELPIIVIGAVGTSFGNRETLMTFTTNIRAGRNYTAYLIGNTWSNANLQMIITSD